MLVKIKDALSGIFDNSLKSLIDYLRQRHPLRMLFDGMFIVTVSWGVSSAYIVATNFDLIRAKFGLEDPSALQKNLSQLAKNAKAIQFILDDVRTRTNAGRSFIVLFHNGKNTLDGKSFFFKSMTNESDRPGVAAAIELAQNLPAAINIDQIQTILDDQCYAYRVADGKNPAFDDLMKKQGMAKTLDCPLRNLDGVIIGYLGIAFLEEDDQKIQDHAVFEIFREATEKMRFLL